MTPSSPTLPEPAPTPDETGTLRLGVARRGERSYARDQYHQGALRVLRPHYLDATGQVTYTVINPGGAYLGADRYTIDIDVADHASLLLTTQSATKVYRTPQGPARQDMTVRLGPGAVLENLPDQLIVYRGGSYRQRTHVTMDASASLVLAEVVTPGWSPDGARFAYDEIRLRTQVDVVDPSGPRTLVVDQLRVVPDADTTGIGVMEGRSHVGQLLVVDARVDDSLIDDLAALVAEHTGRNATVAAVSRVGSTVGEDSPLTGAALRALGDRTEHLTDLITSVVDLLRARWRDAPPVRLRKY